MEENRKVALITGAARGIGKEIAIELAKNACDVSINYRTKTDELDLLKKEIEEKYKVRCFLTQGDVAIYEDFESVIDINLVGTFNVTRNVIPFMVKQKSGKIINISSVVGVSGNAGQTNYSASKAGIIGFTKSLAKEVASRNILVNSVAPG